MDGYTLQQMQLHAKMVTEESGEEEGAKDNTCQLLWQGILAKRSFTGFKFQVLHLFYSLCPIINSAYVEFEWCCQVSLHELCSYRRFKYLYMSHPAYWVSFL